MQVYKFGVDYKPIDGGPKFTMRLSDVFTMNLDEETASNFKFDKVIRLDFPQDNRTVFMSDRKEKLDDVLVGMEYIKEMHYKGMPKFEHFDIKTDDKGLIIDDKDSTL